jgi:hypothetical protein
MQIDIHIQKTYSCLFKVSSTGKLSLELNYFWITVNQHCNTSPSVSTTTRRAETIQATINNLLYLIQLIFIIHIYIYQTWCMNMLTSIYVLFTANSSKDKLTLIFVKCYGKEMIALTVTSGKDNDYFGNLWVFKIW